jgi:hypothetical protein
LVSDQCITRKNEHGETIGYIGSLTDITYTKNQIEEILRQSATVFDHTREGIMITDTQSHIVRINPALTALFGYSERELLIKNQLYSNPVSTQLSFTE